MNNETKYHFTIIIPHKNIPNLLDRALASIPMRDDVQIIIVDDSSNADIVDFENFPGRSRPHTEIVYTKEGKGAGYARNKGLEKVKGEWLLFLDADDYYLNNFNEAIDGIVQSSAELLYFRSISRNSETGQLSNRTKVYDKLFSLYFSGTISLERFKYQMGPVWGKFIKYDLVQRNSIRFDETTVSNDVRFSYLCDFYAKEIEIIDKAIYCATERRGSLQNPLSMQPSFENRKVSIIVRWEKLLFLKKNELLYKDAERFAGSLLMKEIRKSRTGFKTIRQNILMLGFTNNQINGILFRTFLLDYLLFVPKRIYHILFTK